MNSMNNDDFTTDPLFAPLRHFASQGDSPEMPLTIREAFRDGKKNKRRRTLVFRGLFGAGLIAIAFPTLSAAKLLPAPVQHLVEHINKTLTAPVSGLFGKHDTAAAPAPTATPDPTNTPAIDREDAAEVSATSPTSATSASTSDDDQAPTAQPVAAAQPSADDDSLTSYPDGDGNYDDESNGQSASTQQVSDNSGGGDDGDDSGDSSQGDDGH